MKNSYIIVDKSILPDCYERVIEARTALSEGRYRDVSEAVKAVGISRSTYYKYKDFVFLPDNFSPNRKAVISFSLIHETGKLSEVLRIISACEASILTINQNLPINGKAHIVVSLDITSSGSTAEEITEKISGIKGASGTRLVSVG
ncbi:MAG: ACT domain-containing protein [Clostridia bacterium]|nr:ACT domain-containing protein [Clostridia bacterium]